MAVLGGVVDGLRWLSVASVELFFLLFDDGALICPMPLVFVVDVALWGFLPSVGVVSAPAIIVASLAPPSSVDWRPEIVFTAFGFFVWSA